MSADGPAGSTGDARRRCASTLGCLGAAGLLLVAAPCPATAVTPRVLYVNDGTGTCTNAGSGTLARPFCTISAAAARSSPGQTVIVFPGTYREDVHIVVSGQPGAPIVFRSSAPQQAIVRDRTNAFTVPASWVTIRGFRVRGTTGVGISVMGGAHVSVLGNDVGFAGSPLPGMTSPGIRMSGVRDSIVRGNVSARNSDYGILVTKGSDAVRVTGNSVYRNAREFQRAAAGIRVAGSTATVVDRNVSRANEDSGIECYPGTSNTLITENVVHDNGDHGIDNLGATGQRIVGNTVYRNVTAGINVEGGSTAATVANNISVDNGIQSPRTSGDIRVDHSSIAGTAMDYDLIHLSAAGTLLVWDSIGYPSLSSFRTGAGEESHGIDAWPRWRDRTGGDFHLTAGSPAIDSANAAAPGEQRTDFRDLPRADDPATPNTGAGIRTYDDRGAYELQP